MIQIEKLLELKNNVKINSPLIHCITNPISINGCANIILSTGAKAIMAEHPLELEEITSISSALLINTGNITDVRIKSFNIAAKTAIKKTIPIVIDIVGTSCSSLRLNFIKDFLRKYSVSLIKGNMSEIKALLDIKNSSIGIDVGEKDKINDSNLKASVLIAKDLAKKYNTTVLITGKYDIIANKNVSYIVKNGNENLSNITGTGCMLGALVASYLSFSDAICASLLATITMGISGENIEYNGPGSFYSNLLDYIYSISNEELINKCKFELYGSNYA